ncbi:LOW QUALITY PROTEIN: hypothetical protein PHPALM_29672 [Phytophthora palmivora]|uniref:ATP-binding cassette (ABC) Superfamily n=1 Tax=Phytophthora palmivora TaxID=4796 RepID=A0A2P4X6Y6_9STRA|nr:LOW QUALITY PROTEIN: hypothetical protein PHPALM_29672 [Phytophthora palmivora]
MFLEHLKPPRGLNHGRTSRGAYERALVQVEPLFVNDIEAARCVLLAPTEFLSRNSLVENTTTQYQAEDMFWRWVSLKNFTAQELKELREDRLLSCVSNQVELRIEFTHLIAKRAQDERGYGSVNPGTVHRKTAKKPRTTYAPTVADPNYLQPSGSQPGAGLPAPTSSVTRGNPATSLAAGALALPRAPQLLDDPLHMIVELAVPVKEGRRSSRTRHLLSLILLDPQLRVGTLWGPCKATRSLRDRVYAIEIALGLGPGGQAAAPDGKPGALEVLRQDVTLLVVRLESSTGVLITEFRLPP